MSAATKLPPLPDQEPQVGPPSAHDPRAGDMLPPIPIAIALAVAVAVPHSAAPSLIARGDGSVGKATHTLLILFVIGLVAFTAGIALASTVLLGILDLNTGWVKDLLQAVKDLAKAHSG